MSPEEPLLRPEPPDRVLLHPRPPDPPQRGEVSPGRHPADPWLSLALSILAPGLGQFYCGRRVRAVAWLAACVGAFAGWMDWMLSPVRHSWLEGGTWLAAGFVLEFGCWADAFLLARHGRARIRRRVRPASPGRDLAPSGRGFFRRGRPRPVVALALSALFPGLGHLYLLARPWPLLVPLAPLLLTPGAAVMAARVLEESPGPWWPAWLLNWPLLAGTLAQAVLSAFAMAHSWYLALRIRHPRLLRLRRLRRSRRSRRSRPPHPPRMGRVIWILAAAAWLNGSLPWEGWIKAHVKAFRIPSASMEPTLMVGDRIWAMRMASYSRGDIIVFRPPDRPAEDYVKRVAGLPGESLRIRGGRLFINGKRVPEPWAVFGPRGGVLRDFGPVKVPMDGYFVLGDNRDNSRDSRYFGPAARKAIFGKAYKRYWPLDRTGPLSASPVAATGKP